MITDDRSFAGPRFAAVVALIATTLVGTATAHQGVQNAAVLARMDNMTAIADETEILVNMARGTTPLDTELAEAARARLQDHAARVVDLFETRETDPRMEALPVIWEAFDDFQAKADDMVRVVTGLSGRLNTRDEVVAAVRDLGATCTACHDVYREAE